MRIKSIIPCVCAVLLACGCLFRAEPYTPTRYYGLTVPPALESGYSVDVLPFLMGGPYQGRMVIRMEGNELVNDEYNRWTMSPERLLTRYLHLAFASPGAGSGTCEFELGGKVHVFEMDLLRKEAVLLVDYTLKDTESGQERGGTVRLSTPLKEYAPDKLALALSGTCADLVDIIEKDMRELSENKKGSN